VSEIKEFGARMKDSILRLLGIWSFEPAQKGWKGYWSARASWGEVAGRPGLAFGFVLNDRRFLLNFCLGWPVFYIRLRFLERWTGEARDCMGDRWGFSLVDGRSIHLNWRDKTKIIDLPWSWDVVRKSELLADETWAHDFYGKGKRLTWEERKALTLWKRELPYTYVLRCGEVQERLATIRVEEWECRQLWLRWCPLFARVRRSIWVEFSGEVGEGTGSWKGGTMGCGYDMKKGESPEDCLRRMERERKFNR